MSKKVKSVGRKHSSSCLKGRNGGWGCCCVPKETWVSASDEDATHVVVPIAEDDDE